MRGSFFSSRLFQLAFATCIVLGAGRGAAAEWVLTYAVTDEVTIASPDEATPPRRETRSFTQTVTLGEDTVAVQDDRRTMIYRISTRRVLNVSGEHNTYQDWSLFSLVDGREAELFNRNALGAAMRAAKIDEAASQFRRFDSETELHMESQPHPSNETAPVMEPVKRGDRLEFRYDGQIVAQFVPTETRLPPALHQRFVNYLAYSCAIHPEIRRAIAATGTVPQELIFTSRSVNRQTTSTRHLISSAPSHSDRSLLPAGATLAGAGGDSVLQLVATVHEVARSGQLPTRDAAIAFARARVAEKNALDALMALIEYGLQSGDNLTAEIRRHRAIFEADDRCQRYLKAFNQSSKALCEQNLALSDSIDRTGLRKSHQLDLQRANHLDRLGKPKEALEAYLNVVRANPAHAGALHDLGMLLARTYEHPKAWACWDAARRLYPAHPLFKDVIAREQRLLTGHPDFF